MFLVCFARLENTSKCETPPALDDICGVLPEVQLSLMSLSGSRLVHDQPPFNQWCTNDSLSLRRCNGFYWGVLNEVCQNHGT